MNLPNWENIHTIIFDFDGIFTDNKVYVDENATECVRCSRGDGLGIDILRDFSRKKNWNLDTFILSKEKNLVVEKRSKKLKLKCYCGIDNKLEFIKSYLKERFGLRKNIEKGVIYLGNDLNDLEAMLFVGSSIAPEDAHHKILSIANFISNKKGGDGFVRNFIEDLIRFQEYDFNIQNF